MGNHEARVQASFLDKEGWQFTEGGVHQPLYPPLTDAGQLMHTYGQVVQRLKRHKGECGVSNNDVRCLQSKMWSAVRFFFFSLIESQRIHETGEYNTPQNTSTTYFRKKKEEWWCLAPLPPGGVPHKRQGHVCPSHPLSRSQHNIW